MWEFTTHLLSSTGFEPHGHCYLWQSAILWLHVLSDLGIALAYYSIPLALFTFVAKRRDLAYPWMFVLFGDSSPPAFRSPPRPSCGRSSRLLWRCPGPPS